MPQIQANGLALEYERFGPTDRETVLLIMGLGAQMTRWPVELCHELVARGYHVIRFDNRDVGLSAKMDAAGMPDMNAIFAAIGTGAPVTSAYSLDEMADDAVGLLTALGIERAHIVGASMGGMIAQLVASGHPERALSLTSIMSTTGNREVPNGTPEALGALLSPAAPADDLDAIATRGAYISKVIGSPGFPTDESTRREASVADAQRSYYPVGAARQMAAIASNGDRRAKLAKITAPTVVLHGADDPLVPVQGGRDTAANIAGAELRIIEGMGHDCPVALVPVFADAITAAAERSRR
jgi:pimeloyl-ACP methyl ester carboxylesterase